jgi:DNA-binding PadR family transcriptional regulator
MTESVTNKSETATMRSPLAWALLGLIIERPSHGYELAQRFQRVYADSLVLSNALHIYRLLETLSGHGWIETLSSDAPSEEAGGDEEYTGSGQPRPRYRATAQGVLAYEGWLIGHLGEERRRSWLFARQLAMLQPEAALAVIERYELECLDEAGEVEGEVAERIADRLADEDDRLALGAKLSWLAYARRELKALINARAKRQ